MTQIPNSSNNDSGDDQQKLQGYQDDFDTSQKDQFADETGSDPSDDVPATRAEFRQGLRDTAVSDQEGGTENQTNDSEPSLASADDYREDLEDRGEDDKERSMPSWR